jgi:energy-coupling factor transport system permease protein
MSFFYKLDPRTKLLFVMVFTLLVFFINGLFPAVCLMFLLFIIHLAAKIPFPGIKNIRNLSLLAFFIITMQIFFASGNNYIVAPLFGGIISLKWEGFYLGLLIVCRLISMLILFSVFTKTTPPYSLAVGLNTLGLNYRAAFTITFAFSLVSHFREEALVIMDAQKLRGMRSLEKGSFIARTKAWSFIILPLMLGAMRKAQNSAIAMDSRAFGVYKSRTWLEKPRIKAVDLIFIFSVVVIFAGFLFFNYSKGFRILCPGK